MKKKTNTACDPGLDVGSEDFCCYCYKGLYWDNQKNLNEIYRTDGNIVFMLIL